MSALDAKNCGREPGGLWTNVLREEYVTSGKQADIPLIFQGDASFGFIALIRTAELSPAAGAFAIESLR
jgi:hypothetical protein